MANLTEIQWAVLDALRAVETTEEPADPRDVGRRALLALTRNHKHPGEWAASHLYALQRKGLAFTNAPGAARGWWRITGAGLSALAEHEKEMGK